MATATKPKAKRPAKPRRPTFVMFDELLADLGVTADRVRLDPPPGTATARDVLRLRHETGRLFELIDGTLVEKPVSVDAALIAVYLAQLVALAYGNAAEHGVFVGADGFIRISSRFVRAPDVSFFSWAKLPGRKFPRGPFADIVPDLAVEVLSPRNTGPEMARKRREYFDAGVRLVWMIDPKKRTVEVYTSVDDVTRLTAADTLTGGDVLPGLELAVADLFNLLADDPPAESKKKPKPKRKK